MKQKENKPKICIFHTEFAVSGGAEKVVFKQLEYFNKMGYEVSCFVAFVDEKNSFPELIASYDIKQILPHFFNTFLTNDILIFLTTILFPFVLFRFRTYDVFIGENQGSTWWAFVSASFFGKKYLIWQTYPATITHPREIDKGVSRNSFIINSFINLFKPLAIKFDKFVAKKAAYAFSCGAYAQKVLEKVYNRQIINCPPGFEKGEFNSKIFSKRFLGSLRIGKTLIKKPYMLMTLRHVKEKRLDWAIEIFARLRMNNLKFVITGQETNYTRILKKVIKENKLGKHVYLSGLVEEKDLIKLYKNAFLYIYTAPEADYVMGIQEAMSYGLVTIAFNNAGPSCIIKHNQTGYLVQPYSLNEFVNRIKQVYEDRENNLLMSKKSFVESRKYTWEKHCATLERYVLKVLEE